MEVGEGGSAVKKVKVTDGRRREWRSGARAAVMDVLELGLIIRIEIAIDGGGEGGMEE